MVRCPISELTRRRGSQAQTDAALRHVAAVWPIIQEIQAEGVVTLTGLAATLNERGIPRSLGPTLLQP